MKPDMSVAIRIPAMRMNAGKRSFSLRVASGAGLVLLYS